MTQAAPRHPHHHRHAAAPAIADLGRVVHELIEPGGDEVVELHFADRPLTRERGADADAEHARLRERRIQDPVAELLEQRPQQQERVAVRTADVLAVDEDPRIGSQRVARRRASPLRATCVRAVERHPRLEPPAATRRARRRRQPRRPAARGGRAALRRRTHRSPLLLRPARARRSPGAPAPRPASRPPASSGRARSVDESCRLQARRVQRDRIARPRYRTARGSRSPARSPPDIPTTPAGPSRDRACRRDGRGRTSACSRAR